MKCKLFLPYIELSDSDFYVDDNYYKNGEYAKALDNNFKSNKEIEHEFSDNKERNKYTTCECEVFTERMEASTVDSLVSDAVSSDVTVLIFKFDFDSMDYEFEEELKVWIREHRQISTNSLFTDDEKYLKSPRKTIKLSFPNLKGIDTFLELCDCRLLESVDDDGYAILIEKINFTTKV